MRAIVMDYGLCLMWPLEEKQAQVHSLRLSIAISRSDYERLQLNGTPEGFRGRTSHHNVTHRHPT